MPSAAPSSTRYDVLVIGGALSGAATALLLLREQPGLKVLIVDKSATFGRRVGEATVEVSCYFLSRVLGLTQHLNDSHLVKQGMRFWFYNDPARTLADCTEIGGRYLSRVPSFQVDRSVLDEEVLRLAREAGAEVWREVSVGHVHLAAGGGQTITVKRGEEVLDLRSRWVVDASGVAALLARQEGWWRVNKAHPTCAAWARWTGVKDWDGPELAKKFPEWSKACYGIRSTATNHLIGRGWWAWCIPLKGGDYSIGVVFDQRLVKWPDHGSIGQRLKEFLLQHPVGKEVLANARFREGDVHWRKQLPYYSTTFAGDGFALVGDAAGFLDPFYSPGMDWISFTASATANLILAQHRGEAMAPLLLRHNAQFARSYDRWFQAIFKDKYDYMGDYDFMRLAFLLDLGLYYLGVASQPYKYGAKGLNEPAFANPLATPFYHLIRFYNRRFAQMARARKRRDLWGPRNTGVRFMFQGYTFDHTLFSHIFKGLRGWAWLELTEGWRSWFSERKGVAE
jgi:flavin-dependent dehydrogenase